MPLTRIILIAALLAMSLPASAQEFIDGEVRKLDRAAKKVTIKHAHIKAIDMPAMTMDFQVKDLALLKGLKRGDRIRFVAEKMDGGIFVTRIEPRK
jgi:Cu/Ag efflux protein CusF